MSGHPELAGQTVVVIGGSSGIGLETARRARDEGAEVILTARDAERLTAGRGRQRRSRSGSGLGRSAWCGGPGGLGQPWLSRGTRPPPGDRALRVARGRGAEEASRLRGSGAARPKRLGALRSMDAGRRRRRRARGRRADRLPVSRPRRSPDHGTHRSRNSGPVPRAHRRSSARRRPRDSSRSTLSIQA